MEVGVIVVGAGLSGMTAAWTLNNRGLNVVVLEATNRVGGKIQTVRSGDGDPQFGCAEMSGGYVSPSQAHVLRMCEDLGLKTYRCLYKLDGIHYSKGRYKHGTIVPEMWWRNPLAAWDMLVIVRRLEEMCWDIPVDRPWDAPRAKEWDQMTVKDFYDKHCWTRFCHEYFLGVSSMDTSADGRKFSLLFYLWYIRQGNGVYELWHVSEGADAIKIKGGSQLLVETMGRDLCGSIKVNQPVIRVWQGQDFVEVETADGAKYKAKHLILATPPFTQMKIEFDPPLPPMRSSLLRNSPPGNTLYCLVFYKEPFWTHNGYGGFVTCTDDVEILNVVYEDHQPGIELYSLTCSVQYHHQHRVKEMTDQQKQEAVCKCLAKFFDSEVALKPDHFLWKTSEDDPYVGGGYACYFQPGTLTKYGRAMRAPIGSRVFLAGTETATHDYGFMSGAIDAGQRAAREVLCAVGKITPEEVYIQEPAKLREPDWVDKLLPTIDQAVMAGCAALALGVSLLFLTF